MTTVDILIDEKTLRQLVLEYVEKSLGGLLVEMNDIKIEVKSKQNYRSEWESAAFRAVVQKSF